VILKAQARTSASGNSKARRSTNDVHRPIRNIEERKNLRRDLDQEPRRSGIGDGDLLNVAPL
jgi:hypothetical protein